MRVLSNANAINFFMGNCLIICIVLLVFLSRTYIIQIPWRSISITGTENGSVFHSTHQLLHNFHAEEYVASVDPLGLTNDVNNSIRKSLCRA